MFLNNFMRHCPPWSRSSIPCCQGRRARAGRPSPPPLPRALRCGPSACRGALGLRFAGCPAISLGKPDKVRPGRIPSAARQRRTAKIAGSAAFWIATLFSAMLAGLDLVTRLESGLHDGIEIATDADTLRLGKMLEQCEKFACARATICKFATRRTLGIAKLRVRPTPGACLWLAPADGPIERRLAGRRAELR
jgi:hypothetical protein